MGLLSIYNASAGSGKTYTLVYNYLCILFTPQIKNSLPPPDAFKNILAITFTNKAAWEMKSRIISTLEDFSQNGKNTSNDMFFDVMKKSGLSPSQMQMVAGDILSAIYSDYSAFAVCTIDSFTTRLVRSFSRELKLPIGFNIVVDASDILSESIDMLLLKAGKDNAALTSLLLNFVNEKIDEGKVWDISSILQQSGDIWNKEDSIEPMEALSALKIQDYKSLLDSLSSYTSSVEKSLMDVGEKACLLVENVGGADVLYRGSSGIAGVFSKAKDGFFSAINLSSSYVLPFLEGKYFSSKTPATLKENIEQNAAQMIAYFHEIEDIIVKNERAYNFIKILYHPLKKMSVAQQIKQEVGEVKKRSSVMLLREFNEIISQHLREEPVPFIYEKIGERYRHYFIDEFQDTSHLQWENLKHLVYNQIAGNGSALIVGDAKQAIYRWRGGDSTQFINLCHGRTELPPEQLQVQNLDTNYRSSSVIVDFTNEFFTTCAPFVPDVQYQKMYVDGNAQKSKKTVSGFVSITDVQGDTVEVRTPIILQSIVNEITRVLGDGFSYRDIAVLYRSNKDGADIATALAKQGIPVVSTESLLLNESSYVGVVVAMLRFINTPNDRASRASILYYVEQIGGMMGMSDITEYMARCIKSSAKDFLDTVVSLGAGFNSSVLYSLPLYEMVEYIMHGFTMWDRGQDAYLLRFLDCVAEFSSQNAASVSSFLSHWDTVKDKISISSPSDADAVRLLTIHKSKGLEYPVVIFPFASWDIKETEEIWIDTPDDPIFSSLPSSYIKLSDIKKAGLTDIYTPYAGKVRLDNLNILYVAATRPSRQLHIITTLGKNNISRCFGMFLEKTQPCHHCDTEGIYAYSRGERAAGDIYREKNKDTFLLKNIGSTLWRERLRVSLAWKKLWTTSGESAVEYGNMLHQVLSAISCAEDVQGAVGRSVAQGVVDEKKVDDVLLAVENIISHPQLKDYYSDKYTPMNERELLCPDGELLRPDRVCLCGKKAVVIDYKTGAPKNKYSTQVLSYASVLQKMGYHVEKCLLVYISENGVVLEEV